MRIEVSKCDANFSFDLAHGAIKYDVFYKIRRVL